MVVKFMVINYPINSTWRMGSQDLFQWLITMVMVFVPKTYGWDPFQMAEIYGL